MNQIIGVLDGGIVSGTKNIKMTNLLRINNIKDVKDTKKT